MKRPIHLAVLAAFVALLASGFQCASTGTSVAKKAIQNQDYETATKALNDALAANPDDCEARMLLGDVARLSGDTEGMITAYEKAQRCPGLSEKQRTDISVKLFNTWVAEYNAGITSYNAYVESKDVSTLNESIQHLKNALALKPTFTEPMALLGGAYESNGDTTNAYATYIKWWMVEKPGFDILTDKGVVLGMKRQQVLQKLGTPQETQSDSLQGGGVVLKDKIDVGGRMMYVFCSTAATPDTTLEGWTYNPPSSVSQQENWRGRVATLGPLKAMAYLDYHAGRKEHALEVSTVVGKIKPTDQELLPLRAQVLQDLGKTDVAIREIEQELQRDPSKTAYRLQYATLLSGANRNSESVEQYLTVLKAEPTNETALYNLAAAYKNIAGTKQRAELEKMDKDKKYQPDLAYLKDLERSAEYFEKLRQLPKYRTDIIVLEQLANVYEVTKEKAKVKMLIMELEGLESLNSTNKTYYEIMEGLYSRNNMIDKMREASAKAAKL